MRFAPALISIAALLATVPPARAGHLFCHHCGCHTNCKKVCRLECGTKKETKTEYECETEDFCVPGPSHQRGYTYECGPHGHKHRKPIWQPTCAKVHTRKKLVKKEVTKEVPDYKWVVEEYCCICGVLVKMEREPAVKKDAGAADKAASSPSGSKTQTSTDLISPPRVGDVHLLLPHEAADQYAAYYADASDSPGGEHDIAEDIAEVIVDQRQADGASTDGEADDMSKAGAPRRLLEHLFKK